jgi:hypothetical protein
VPEIEDELVARDTAGRVTQPRVLREIARLAFLDRAECFNPDGSLKNVHQMSRDARAAIAGLDVEGLHTDGKSITASKSSSS